MKRLYLFLFLSLYLISINQETQAQSHMYLEESFLQESDAFKAKRKGFAAIGKFEFGPFKVTSGKQGWTSTTGKSNFWSGDASSESQTKASFVLRGEQSESITVNTIFSSIIELDEQNSLLIRTLTGWSYAELNQKDLFIADFSFSDWEETWSLFITYTPFSSENPPVPGELPSSFQGEVVNGDMIIDIIPESRWNNGKSSSLFKPMEAYRFVADGETIGAVQTFPANRLMVWIKNDLESNLRDLIAVSATTLMVKSEQSLNMEF